MKIPLPTPDAAVLVRALEAVEATIALAKDVPEDVIALGRRAAELKRDVQFLTRADDPGKQMPTHRGGDDGALVIQPGHRGIERRGLGDH